MRFKQIVETTTAGSVATVAQPMMTQTRENVNVPGLKPVQQLMKGKSKKKGPYANSINEGKVNEDDLAEQDLIVIPGQGRLRRTGFVKQDLDQGEHEGHTLKNSLHTIARAASDLDKRLSTQSEFPEWVSEKIGAAKGMMVTVMDYLISSQEMQHDRDAMYEDMSNTDYTPQVGEEILWRSRNPMNKMMPVPGTVLAIAPGKVTIKIKSPRLIQNIGKDTIVLNLSNYVLMPKQGVAEASNTMQRYGQKILKRAKAARDAEQAALAAETEPKKEEPPASSDNSSISTRDLMQQLRKPKKKDVAEAKWDPITGGDYSIDGDDNTDVDTKDKFKDMLEYYADTALVSRALGELYKETHGTGYYGSQEPAPVKYLATLEIAPSNKWSEPTRTTKYFANKQEAYKYAASKVGAVTRVVSLEKIDNTDDDSDLITLPVMLGVGNHKKKWMLQFPSERYAQKWEHYYKKVLGFRKSNGSRQ